MNALFRFASAVHRDAAIDRWLDERPGALGGVARRWVAALRACGPDVRELLHDGHPAACVEDAAFAYVDVFQAHVNVGFFRGAELADPDGLLDGTGKLMRHVKVRREDDAVGPSLEALIRTAYDDMKGRVQRERRTP